MSLFGSLQISANALQAQQIGLQVAGQNIANANTPGYSREEVLLSAAPTQRVGGLLFGLGVQVQAVVQRIDEFLEERLRSAISDSRASDIREQVYAQLEGVIGELNDTDISTSLNRFFSSISEVLNQPESIPIRNLAVLQGKTLASDLNRLANRVAEGRVDLNKRVRNMADDINRLLREIRELNIRITTTEGGEAAKSDAVGLRDQRNKALADLARLLTIRVDEQPSGAVNVFAGGDFLVFEGTSREVGVAEVTDRGLATASVRIQSTDVTLGTDTGELAGLISARDEVLGNFQDELDQFAATLTFGFNKVFASGQGLKGYQALTSEHPVQVGVPLDAAGLTFTPVNGSFDVLVFNKQTGLTQTTRVTVDLNGLDNDDTTVEGLLAALNGINGITASRNTSGNVTIGVDSSNLEFAFGADTSGLLAALGLNTFFTGTTAADVGINDAIRVDPGRFAASLNGIAGDTANAVELAGFLDRPLATANGATLSVLYDRLTAGATQGASTAKAVAEGFRVFEETLRGQQLAISGVSLDEEAVRMISYQKAFQASARFIRTISDLLDSLVAL